MPWTQIVDWILRGLLGVASILIFYIGLDRKNLERRLDSIDKRFDDAGEKTSKLATSVQGIIGRLDRLPEDLREKKFTSQETVELMIERAVLGLERRKGNGGR